MGLVDDGSEGLSRRIIGAAIEVHRHWGPGLLEKAYELSLGAELRHGGLRVRRQVPLPMTYRDVKLDCGYRLDLLVEERVVVEVKVVSKLALVHRAQVMTYLRLTGLEVGLLFNFNVVTLSEDGIRRVLNTRAGR